MTRLRLHAVAAEVAADAVAAVATVAAVTAAAIDCKKDFIKGL